MAKPDWTDDDPALDIDTMRFADDGGGQAISSPRLNAEAERTAARFARIAKGSWCLTPMARVWIFILAVIGYVLIVGLNWGALS